MDTKGCLVGVFHRCSILRVENFQEVQTKENFLTDQEFQIDPSQNEKMHYDFCHMSKLDYC